MPIHSEKYDPLVIKTPVSGMNMNISVDSMPFSHAYSICNFFVEKIGEMITRNGTSLFQKIPDKKIYYILPYTKKDGTESFFYVYNNSEDKTKSVLCIGNKELLSFAKDAKMWLYLCAGSLLLCNGVDPIYIFNEEDETLEVFEQKVKLVVTKSGSFYKIKTNYPKIYMNPHVFLTDSENEKYEIIEKNEIDGFKCDKDLMNDQSYIFHVQPPRTTFCSIFGGRIWFLGEGKTSRKFKSKDEAMVIYYSYNLHDIHNFLSPKSGLIPTLVASDITKFNDSLERIDQYLGFLVFFGKKNIYFFENFTEIEKISYTHHIPAGLYHAGQVQAVDNDILFMSESGVKLISRLSRQRLESSTVNISQGRDVSLSEVNGLDPLIMNCQKFLTDENYLYSSSIFFEKTHQIMFKFGLSDTIVFTVINQEYIPYLYTGDFTNSYSLSEGRDYVYLSIRDSVLCYQEQKENSKDVSGAISFVWRTPNLDLNVKTFTTDHVLLGIECSPSFNKSNKNSLFFEVYGEKSGNFLFSKQMKIKSAGDLMSGFSVFGSDDYGTLERVQYQQAMNIEFSKANFRLFGEIHQGKLRISQMALRGVRSHGY